METAGVRALFQAFIPDGKTVALPIEDLYQVATLVEKQEKRSGQQLAGVGALDESTQPLKALTHVDCLVIEVNLVETERAQGLNLS